jgi:Tfp pilus assembly protein PilO
VNGARARYIIAVVAAVVVSVAFYFLFIRARQGELSGVRAQVDQEQARTVELQATLQRLQGLQENAAQFEARLAEIRELVPEDDQVANFIFQVQDEANRSGVGFVEVAPELPKPPPEGASVAEVRVVIGAEGGYFALQDFLRRLYDLDRALRIDNLAITAAESSEGESTPSTLTATARIFFELPEAGAATAPTTTPPSTTAPATGATPPPTTPVTPAPVPPAG